MLLQHFPDDSPRAGEAGLLARDWSELEGRKDDVRRDTAEQQRLANELEAEIRKIIAERHAPGLGAGVAGWALAGDQAFQREISIINQRYGALTRELVSLTDELNLPPPPCTDEVDYIVSRKCIDAVATRYGMVPADFLTKAEMILDAMEYGGGDWPLTMRYFNEIMKKRLY